MKKKEKPTPKQKEFAVSPFKALKGVSLEPREKSAASKGAPAESRGRSAAPAPAPKKPAKSREEMDDEFLFLDAMADVQRLRAAPAATSAPAPAKERLPSRAERDEEEKRVFLRAVESLKMDVRFTDELPEESPQRPAPVNRLRQLRRGAIRVDLELDLHGLTRDEAIENLERFVKGAYNRGQKGVLVITGKGNNSPGEPVLRAVVAAWLREAGKGMVSEFILAPKDMGGSGAIVVFLKEKKAPEQGEGEKG